MPPKVTGQAITVPVDGYSDGDASHRPAGDQYNMITPDIYLEKLARQWMDDRGEAEPGKRYVLDRLPKGYALFARLRQGAKHEDKYLYGHPSHRIFDSPAKFYPHFKWMMEHDGSDDVCNCTVCANAKTKGTAGTSAKGRGRPKAVARGPVDLEGTPDVVTSLVNKLEQRGKVDEPIQEPQSMDWRAERTSLPARIRRECTQYSFTPRLGELVLWTREISGEIIFDKDRFEFKMVDVNTGQDYGHPQWMAGVVGQVAEETVRPEDLLMETDKDFNVNMSGFRVECLPDPNSEQKGYSLQYKYLPLNHIRPFNFWQQYLHGIKERDWHPSIRHALTVMSSLSVVEKFRFKGTWPNATVFCKGLYLGAEAIFVGDAIRIMPPSKEKRITDVLWVQSIRLRLLNLNHQADEDKYLDEEDRFAIVLYLIGKAYTTSRKRAYQDMAVSTSEVTTTFPPGMRGYDQWYHLHNPKNNYLVSKDRVLGRCFEADAMTMWFGHSTIDVGLEGVRAARLYSSEKDKRILGSRNRWYWGETRVDVLDLETLNGLPVGQYDETRNPALWRKLIPTIDGVAGKTETVEAAKASAVVAPVSPFKTVKSSKADEEVVQIEDSEQSSDGSAGVQRRQEDEEAADQLIDELAEGVGFGPRVEEGGEDLSEGEKKAQEVQGERVDESEEEQEERKEDENEIEEDQEDAEMEDDAQGEVHSIRAGAKRLKLGHPSE
ncbi:MAG: hypothetical protein M1836_005318 [Candelina mexicana]|nr:MAG: hypothetical protein M1836_005318 [Candelina mexicana]